MMTSSPFFGVFSFIYFKKRYFYSLRYNLHTVKFTFLCDICTIYSECNHHYSQDIEHFSHHLKFPFCFLEVKPLPPHLITTGLILTFQEFRINLVVQLVTFLVSLLSFSLMLLRLNHVIACICSLLLLLSNILLYGYTTICLSILQLVCM